MTRGCMISATCATWKTLGDTMIRAPISGVPLGAVENVANGQVIGLEMTATP